MYVVTPKEIVVARVRDLDDQVTSAIDENRFQDALEIAKSNKRLLRRNQLPDLVHKYLEDLLHRRQYDKAAAECPALLDNDVTLWEFWVLRFMRENALESLAPHIPVESPRLDPSTYELVLHHFLSTNTLSFLDTIKRWGNPGKPELYSLPMMMKHISNHRDNSKNRDPLLVEAQAQLYVMDDPPQYEEALRCYLGLESSRVCDPQQVFDLIEHHKLHASVRHRVVKLVSISRDLAGEFLVKATDEIPIAVVVEQLKDDPETKLWYLHLLFTKQLDLYNQEKFKEYHRTQVALYAKYSNTSQFLQETDPAEEETGSPSHESHMIRFLRWSDQVPKDFVLEECEKQRPPLYNEMVHIHGMMGNFRKALDLLLEKVGDVHRAIQFVESHDTDVTRELWDILIQYSLENTYGCLCLTYFMLLHVAPFRN